MAAAPILDDPIAALLAKMRLRDDVSGHEADVLRALITRIVDFPVGHVIVEAGRPLTECCLLIDGFVGRYKDLSDGGRQITEVHVAGDFVDLHGFLLKRLDHNIGALTAVRMAIIPHSAIVEITEQEPHLARMLWLSTLVDASIQRERILTLGRRSAVARVAHLFCEVQTRLELIGLADGWGYAFPVVQADLADASGLTPVHVNRMLRELRERGLMTFKGGIVEVEDRAGLEQLAEFDRNYLTIVHAPR